jgi:hypothetical protein
VPHASAPLTETGRLRLARCVVDNGWPQWRVRTVGYHLAGQRVTVRLDDAVMQILDHDRTVLRSLPNPLQSQDRRKTGARPDRHHGCPTCRQRCSAVSAAAAPSWSPTETATGPSRTARKYSNPVMSVPDAGRPESSLA